MMVATLVFVAGLHWLAYALLSPALAEGTGLLASMSTVVTVAVTELLAFFMILSQALESVTRAFYTRSDLELILTSPAAPENAFAVRIWSLTVSTAAMSTLLMAPFINVAATIDHPGWFAAYPVMAALAMVATAIAVWIMMALFAAIGARRTRLVAQIVAAVVGASFLIGIQVAAILSANSLSRATILQDDAVLAALPDADSIVWLPVHAATGDPLALAVLLAVAVASLFCTIRVTAPGFAERIIAATSLAEATAAAGNGARRPFRPRSPRQALRAKEWQLLGRDPWLVSQSLMQVLYLLPPAVLLWKNFGDAAGIAVVIAPVLVMALGQLAGGLAWLTISGEDAPALVRTAPVTPVTLIAAKVEAVLAVIAMVVLPLLLAMAAFAPLEALVTALAIACSATGAIAIQLWFRGEARRAHFRFRQTASRVATFAEAFSSLMWAGAAALAVAGMPAAAVCACLALAVLAVAWFLSPRLA
jgi:ABC-2 type transport system permease protein